MKRKRFYVKVRKCFKKVTSKLDTKESLNEAQLLTIAIVKKAIFHPTAELVIAPISDTRYIHFDNVFIRIEGLTVTIINGLYSYHVILPDQNIVELYVRFNQRMEFKRKCWEKDIMSKMKRSLSDILNELNQK